MQDEFEGLTEFFYYPDPYQSIALHAYLKKHPFSLGKKFVPADVCKDQKYYDTVSKITSFMSSTGHGKLSISRAIKQYRKAIIKANAPSGLQDGIGALAEAKAPPVANRGGTIKETLPSLMAKDRLLVVPTGRRGNYETVHIPKPDLAFHTQHAFVDWVNFTCEIADLNLFSLSGHRALTDHEIVSAMSTQLIGIFGYGVSSQRKSGMNFYNKSFDLGLHNWGLICIGGQKDTLLVSISGQGLMAAFPRWEQNLFDWLSKIPSAKLTRVDLAHDNFNSKITVDGYLEQYRAGLFDNRGKTPNVETRGNWEKPNGKGRTLYLGSRESGKYLRIYEKGLQLSKGFSEKFPNWVRVELELHNKQRIIPFDVLLRPGQYLAGAYPALAGLFIRQERIKTFTKEKASTVDRLLEITRHQFGKYINAFVELYGLDIAFEKLTRGKKDSVSQLAFQKACFSDESSYLDSISLKLQPTVSKAWDLFRIREPELLYA